MEHRFVTQIQARDDAAAFPGAGGDRLSLRVNGEDGECPVGPTLERLIEIAGRHGVKPVAD